MRIEAEATLGEGGERTTALQSVPVGPSSPLVPASIVQYVQRTKEHVILDDAAVARRFSSDPYIALRKPRSVLCLPIRRQAEVVGVLYLENDLLPGAFTPERLLALELLATQAAISVENAELLAKTQAARTASEEARSRSAFLAEAGGLLSESLDYETTLDRLARLCVGSIADWCVIDIIEEGGEIRHVGGAHADREKEPLLRELMRRYPSRRDSAAPLAQVIRSREPVLLPGFDEDQIGRYTYDGEHARIVRALGTASAIVVPLIARGQLVGGMSLVSASPGRYGPADLELVQELAHRAALAVDNAELYRDSQEALQLRNEFLSVASHELYTPITTLLLTVEMMHRAARKGRDLDPRTVLNQLAQLSRQGKRLARLVGELLDVSRIEMHRLPLEPVEVELGALVREVVERMEPDLVKSRCAWSLSAGDPVHGRWDRSRLDQVVTNLLSNAAKFGSGKPIEIAVGAEGGIARITVKDHGIGVDQAEQVRIFERFGRAAPASQYGGLGLGLYISKRIVEAHEGSIRVESQPGAGSTFIVELPCEGPSDVAGPRGRWDA
ncbi:MAG TPA: GAF domain-containing sensor histidine kinase [Myxococcaceae bacterium]